MSAVVAMTTTDGDLLEEPFYVISCDGVSAGGFDATGYLTWIFEERFSYAKLNSDTTRFSTEEDAVKAAKKIIHEDADKAMRSPNGKLMFTPTSSLRVQRITTRIKMTTLVVS